MDGSIYCLSVNVLPTGRTQSPPTTPSSIYLTAHFQCPSTEASGPLTHPPREAEYNSVYFPTAFSLRDSFPKLLGGTPFPPGPSRTLFPMFVIQLDSSVTSCIPSWDSPSFLNSFLKSAYVKVCLCAVKFYAFGTCLHHYSI